MSEVVQQASSQNQGIFLTDSARTHVLAYLAKHPEHSGVRLSVKKTGCSGLSYVVDYVGTPQENDVVLDLDENYVICIDKSSYPFLKGMTMDYVKQGLNSKLVFDNPNKTGECGCGESFTVE